MKKLEGKKIYLSPTGNNARRGGGGCVIEAVVDKVARVFVTLTIGKGHYQEKFRIQESYGNTNRIHLNSGHNSGYFVYATLKEIEDHKKAVLLAAEISNHYNYRGDWERVGLDKLEKVCGILGLSTEPSP